VIYRAGYKSGHVEFIAISPDNQWLAIDNGKIINLKDGSEVGKFENLKGMAGFSKESHYLFGGGAGVWQLDLGTAEISYPLLLHRNSGAGVKISPTHTLLATVEDKIIRIWNYATGEHLSILDGHESEITSVVFSADGTKIASGDKKGHLFLWDIKTLLPISSEKNNESNSKTVHVAPWSTESRVFQTKSGVDITITPGKESNSKTVEQALREVLRQIHSESLNTRQDN
jgi:WD40 repeat protein